MLCVQIVYIAILFSPICGAMVDLVLLSLEPIVPRALRDLDALLQLRSRLDMCSLRKLLVADAVLYCLAVGREIERARCKVLFLMAELYSELPNLTLN